MHLKVQGEMLVGQISGEWAGQTAQNFIHRFFKIQERRIQSLFQQGCIWIGNHALFYSERDSILQAGDVFRIRILEPEFFSLEPEYLPDLEIVWEDDHILVVNKPGNRLVHPSEPNQRGTLDAGIAYHYLLQGEERKSRHIHRLDKGTSGLVLYAKHSEAHRILDQQLADKKITRLYHGIVKGQVYPTAGTLNFSIGRDRHMRNKRVVTHSGVSAVTHYRVIHSWKHPLYGHLSLLEFKLETGRTHQIRVHISHKGYPLVGDTLYGGLQIDELEEGRLALHAYQLDFTHPYEQKKVICETQMATDLDLLLKNSLE